MSLTTFLSSLGSFFVRLFTNIEKAWNQEEPVIQKGLLTSANIVQDIKVNLDKTPDIVFQLLQSKYPDLSKSVLQNGLQAVAGGIDTSIKIVVSDPIQTLGNIMEFLRPLTGNVWSDKLQSAFKLLAAELLPGTPFEKIALFAQFVYTNFIQVH